jgi:asparagine synthetase B (glutamine-hydrolysing)
VQRACARIAPSHFMRGGVEKQALRDALQGLLPAATLTRRKQPFFASPMLLSERPGRLLALARATLTAPAAPAFVNQRAVAQQLDRLRGASLVERRAWEPPLMWMLTTALLERELLR